MNKRRRHAAKRRRLARWMWEHRQSWRFFVYVRPGLRLGETWRQGYRRWRAERAPVTVRYTVWLQSEDMRSRGLPLVRFDSVGIGEAGEA